MRLSLRGIGVPIVVLYLIELGGIETEPGLIVGPGWQARVWAGEPVRLHALRLGVTEVEFNGEPATVEQVVMRFQKKAIRAGG
ncbi:MAG: hypothetical protein ACP5UQ_10565 [Anaerolineae bacterium]